MPLGMLEATCAAGGATLGGGAEVEAVDAAGDAVESTDAAGVADADAAAEVESAAECDGEQATKRVLATAASSDGERLSADMWPVGARGADVGALDRTPSEMYARVRVPQQGEAAQISTMRVILQRVSSASVSIAGSVVGAIDRGFVLLVGFTHTDTDDDVAWMASRIVGLRLFNDDAGKMNRSLDEVAGALLVISQFTVYGDARKGRRPSFIDAARPETAIPLYERFVAALRATGTRVETGEFGADMQVALVNDGPVTLVMDRP